jgi:malic enzyme
VIFAGVAEPCLSIQQNGKYAYEYTAKGHLIGVITNGTAVLGLGNIGALAGRLHACKGWLHIAQENAAFKIVASAV